MNRRVGSLKDPGAKSVNSRKSLLLAMLCIAPTVLCTAPTLAHSAELGAGEAALDRFVERVRTLRADFEQTVVDANGREMDRTVGTLAVRRPGRFRWDYREPFVQAIVSDGTHIWMFDEELNQVTVRELDDTLASTPAMLLSGDGDLRAQSAVEDLGVRDGLAWVGVAPQVRDTEFDAVRIGFRDGVVAVMELVDGFGQTTRIEFRNVAVNVEIDDGVFRFTPPAGADVIR